jgi:hypothetical protein
MKEIYIMSEISKQLADLKARGTAMAVQRAQRVAKANKPLSEQGTGTIGGTVLNFNHGLTLTRIKACIEWHTRKDRKDEDGHLMPVEKLSSEQAKVFIEAYDKSVKEEMQQLTLAE